MTDYDMAYSQTTNKPRAPRGKDTESKQHTNFAVQLSSNPFKPNIISHCYQLDLSISVLRAVDGLCILHFYSNILILG